jgi:hypothetical protein
LQTPKAAETSERERGEIQRRVDLVVTRAREQKAAEIQKAKEEVE